MREFKIILKSGESFEVKCEHVTLKHIDNELTSYHFEGLSEKYDYPLYIRIDEIVAVIELRKDSAE